MSDIAKDEYQELPAAPAGPGFWVRELPYLIILVLTLGGVTRLQVAAVVWQLMWFFLVGSSLTVLAASLSRRTISIFVISLLLMFMAQVVAGIIEVLVRGLFYNVAWNISNSPPWNISTLRTWSWLVGLS